MMVDVMNVLIILIWSIFCFMMGITTGLWYAGNQAINEWFERELNR